MSQRHRRARLGATTQVDYTTSSAGNSPLLATASLRSFSDSSDKERTESVDSCDLVLSEERGGQSYSGGGSGSVTSEFYEDSASLYERMSKAEEVRGLYVYICCTYYHSD